MRQIVVPFIVLLSALSAVPALAATPAAADQSALFSLRLDVDSPVVGRFSYVGTGKIDGVRRLSTLDFRAGGNRFEAMIGASPGLTIFLKNGLSQNSSWYRQSTADAGPLIDPGVALRLEGQHGRALGTEKLDGVSTTKVALTVGLPDAALLATMVSKQDLVQGVPVVVWIDGSGSVRRLYAVVPWGTGRVVIDERLSAFGTPVRLTRPTVPHVWQPPEVSAAEQRLHDVLPDVETYRLANSSKGADDPNPQLTGYAGMTASYLRNTYDLSMPNITIVRATATTYCIQATARGVTAHKSGPTAPFASGPC
jgi:hypothetical protein